MIIYIIYHKSYLVFVEESDDHFNANNNDEVANAHPTTIKRFQAIIRQYLTIANNPNSNSNIPVSLEAIEIQKAFHHLESDLQQFIKDVFF